MDTKIGNDIITAKKLLQNGELVAIPTETVYGLAANALDEEAIAKIYKVKNRPQFNPLILHVAKISDIEKYVTEIPEKIQKLINVFMPGPLTILLPKKNISDLVTAGSSKVAIRIPDNELSLKLLNEIDFPIVAPSANTSGYVSPTSAKHVFDNLNGKINYILDGGDCNIGLESTIVGINEHNEIELYRLGGLSIEFIEEVLEEKIKIKLQHKSPKTPGQLKSHYATHTPLYLGEINELISKNENKKTVVINYNSFKNIDKNIIQFCLTPNNKIIEAAKNLFNILRQADDLNADVIISELAPQEGIGLAINDRLKKAQFIMK